MPSEGSRAANRSRGTEQSVTNDRALNRRFLAYLFAAAAADSGYWVTQVAQGWLVVKLTNSPLWLGLVSAATQLPFLLFSLAGGDLADRFERRHIIAINNGVTAAIACLTAVLVATGTISVGLLAALGFLLGTCNAIEHPVDRAWVYDLVGREAIGRAIGLSALEWATARTIGPAIGGIAIATIGIAAGYGAYALFVLPIIVLALIVRTHNASAPDDTQTETERADASRAIVAFSAFTAVFTIGVTPYIALLPDIAKNTFAALLLSWRGDIAHKGRIAIGAALIGALLLIAFTQTHGFIPALMLLAAMGAIDTVMYALTNTYVQEIAGDSARGRANAIFSLAFLGGIPLGNAILGLFAGRFGSLPVLSWSATAVAAIAVLFWFAAPKTRDAA
jgi:MFS family permease